MPGLFQGSASDEYVQSAAGTSGSDIKDADAVGAVVASPQVSPCHPAAAILDKVGEHSVELSTLKLMGGTDGGRYGQGRIVQGRLSGLLLGPVGNDDTER